MWRDHLKIALRQLFIQRGYSLINILGLASGLTFSLLILLWVQDELKYDQFHEDGDRIYHARFQSQSESGEIQVTDVVSYPYYKALRDEVPGVESAGIIEFSSDRWIKTGELSFKEKGTMGSYSMFRIFSFPILAGSVTDKEKELKTLLISERLAKKLYGEDWRNHSIGKSLEIDGEKGYTIIGVFEDIPAYSSLQFDFFINFEKKAKEEDWVHRWGNWTFFVYFKAAQNANLDQIRETVTSLYKKTEAFEEGEAAFLYPFSQTYLKGNFKNGEAVGGRISYVNLFTYGALFLLLIACINFINLATARAARRAKEVGIRKVIGAGKRNLIIQFLTEAFLLTSISFFISLIIADLLLPSVNILTEKSLTINYASANFWIMTIAMIGVVTILAGLYPAFVLSSFRISNVLKGKFTHHFSHQSFRKGLVILQFCLSIFFLLGSMIIHQQVSYIKDKNLGISKDHLVYMEMGAPMYEQFDTYKEELLKQSGIEEVVRTSHVPLNIQSITGDFDWEGKGSDRRLDFNLLFIDHADFQDAFDLSMASGRFYQEELKMDTASIVINETTQRLMGVEDAVGMKVRFWDSPYTVIGVVKDFHIQSLYSEIQPLLIVNMPDNTWSLFIKTTAGQTETALASLQQVHRKLFPDYPLEYQFLDKAYENLYKSEMLVATLSQYFMMIAIIVSCLGLLGLAAFSAQQRTKEVGIRKVLGASVSQLLILLTKEYGLLILISLVISIPIALFSLQNWLSKFEFHIEISWLQIALTALIMLMAAMLTVSFHSLKAATGNPVDSLKYE